MIKHLLEETSSSFTMLLHVIKKLEVSLKALCNLSITQSRILYSLAIHNGIQQISEISLTLGIKPNTTTVAVTGLEKKGLLERKDCEEDFRIVYISITQDGLSMAEKINKAIVQTLRDSFEPIETILCEDLKIETGYTRIYDKILMGENSFENTFALWQHYYSNRATIAKHAKAEGLTVVDYRVLLETSLHSRGITPSELASRLMLKVGEVSCSIRALAKMELVKRSRGNCDRRSILVEITSDGFAVLDRIAPVIFKEASRKSLAVGDGERQATLELSFVFNERERKRFRTV